MFTGFNQKFPEYEVVTPQTNLSFTLRTLTVQEEERLKGSFVTPQKIIDHLNKCIYDAIVQKPESIPDYKTFLEKITTKDRDALLYGLYHITYEEIRNYDVTCSSCGKSQPVTVKASDTFNAIPYEGKNILEEESAVKLPITTNVTAIICQPTLAMEENILRSFAGSAEFSSDIVSETLFIKRFEEDIEEQVNPTIYDNRRDIIEAFGSLPAKDKRKLLKEYQDKFGKYGCSLKMRVYCPHCGEQEVVDIDLVDNFFRALFE